MSTNARSVGEFGIVNRTVGLVGPGSSTVTVPAGKPSEVTVAYAAPGAASAIAAAAAGARATRRRIGMRTERRRSGGGGGPPPPPPPPLLPPRAPTQTPHPLRAPP